jgi:hypothetical protein
MELKTQALDRVLEALSPALAAELDRVVNETREALEEEFQKRLQAAVREAENTMKKAADAELQRSVSEAREIARAQVEATRAQVTDELEQRFKRTLEDATNRLKSESSLERERLQEQLHQWRTFADAQRQLGDASSQPEILARFMKLADSFAAGLAVYVNKADGLALWKNRGKAAFPEIISEETTDPESYFRTINVRGKVVAAVSATPPFKAEVLDFLGSAMERAIENFGLKLRAPIPSKPLVAAEKTLAIPTGGAPPGAVAATVQATDDPKLHAEARRTARLLISEIKLYHEEELRAGRENSDIYERLRKEIDGGRQTYTSRVPQGVQVSRDYFHEELVRILGDNDISRLGVGYPGPKNS